MKKTLTLTALFLLTLTGCSAGNNTASTPETSQPSTSASASSSPTPSPSMSDIKTPDETPAASDIPSETSSPQAVETADPLPGSSAGDVPPDLAAWQATYGPYHAILREDGISWADAQGNPVYGQPQWISTYPFSPEEQAQVEKSFNEFVDGLDSTIQEGADDYSSAAPDDSYATADVAGPTAIDGEEFCNSLDPATASSGEIQYCNVEVGIPVTGIGS
ncbi:hypothetical protein ACIP5Z_01470 [Rothia terrae]|uniref:hypothetical protein n=1 Tax=Rothia terrae TaxID=396015 RepID=UPI00382316FD